MYSPQNCPEQWGTSKILHQFSWFFLGAQAFSSFAGRLETGQKKVGEGWMGRWRWGMAYSDAWEGSSELLIALSRLATTETCHWILGKPIDQISQAGCFYIILHTISVIFCVGGPLLDGFPWICAFPAGYSWTPDILTGSSVGFIRFKQEWFQNWSQQYPMMNKDDQNLFTRDFWGRYTIVKTKNLDVNVVRTAPKESITKLCGCPPHATLHARVSGALKKYRRPLNINFHLFF